MRQKGKGIAADVKNGDARRLIEGRTNHAAPASNLAISGAKKGAKHGRSGVSATLVRVKAAAWVTPIKEGLPVLSESDQKRCLRFCQGESNRLTLAALK